MIRAVQCEYNYKYDFDPCCHNMCYYFGIPHSILTMICISCFILIDQVTEEGITAIPLVAVLMGAPSIILQASVGSSMAMSAVALKLTRTLIKVDVDASQIKILFVSM